MNAHETYKREGKLEQGKLLVERCWGRPESHHSLQRIATPATAALTTISDEGEAADPESKVKEWS